MGFAKRTAFHEHIYWRSVSGGMQWHCYQQVGPARGRMFESLCGRYTRTGSGGQTLSRPPVAARCGMCDGEEMKMLKAEESLPMSKNWVAGEY